MDLSLPVIDSRGVSHPPNADAQTCNTRVIASTAHATAGVREPALAGGCDDVDTRSVGLDRLIGKMEAWLAVTGASGSLP